MIVQDCKQNDATTPITSLQNAALPLVANTDWLGADLVPVNTPTVFRIRVAVSIGGNFSAVITNGGNIQTLLFNAVAGPALVAGARYTFEMLVGAGDTVNFRYSAAAPGATIQKLIVQELTPRWHNHERDFLNKSDANSEMRI